MLATIHPRPCRASTPEPVLVEVNTGEAGAPDLILVGLPDRRRKGIGGSRFLGSEHSGFHMPRSPTTIISHPAISARKARSMICPSPSGAAGHGQLTVDHLADYLIAGELSLSGATRPMRGALAIALLARDLGKRGCWLPPSSAAEAALVDGLAVYSVRSLDEAYRFSQGSSR